MIYLASDHGGYEMKNSILEYLLDSGIKVKDFGPFAYDKFDDYPDFIIPAAIEVAKDENNFGIFLGGSGQGEAWAANKVKGIRAALYYGGPLEIVVNSKTHNNANVLSLGAKHLTQLEVISVVKLWIETAFPNEERHLRRLNKVDFPALV